MAEKIKFDIQEISKVLLDDDEILFTLKTIADLKLENRKIKLPSNEGGKSIVLRAVSSNEVLDDNVGYVNAHVYARIAGNKISPDKLDVITLGADPEFFLANNKSKKAMSFGIVVQTKRELGHHGRDIGMDGAGFIGEFRPVPGKTEEELTSNLKDLIVRTHGYINETIKREKLRGPATDWTLYGHSYYEGRPSGFHVHLGLPQAVLSNKEHLASLVRSLDYFLGVPCLKIDKQYGRRIRIPGKRQTGNYGKAGSYKYGSVTMEYRMPGGYYLRHPMLTEGLVGMSALVAEDFVTRAKVLGKKKVDESRLYKGPLYSEVRQAFNRIEWPDINVWLDDISAKTEKMVTYNRHKKSVNFLLEAARVELDLNEDILLNWEAS